MIIVIAEESINPKTGRKEVLVSHGVNIDNGKNVVLPQVSLKEIGAIYNSELEEYVLPEPNA